MCYIIDFALVKFQHGTIGVSDKGKNKMLRQVRVPVWDDQRCKSVYDETRGYIVDETMMCAGLADGGKDSCQVGMHK